MAIDQWSLFHSRPDKYRSEHMTVQCRDVAIVLRDYLDTPVTDDDKTPVRVSDASLYLRINGVWEYRRAFVGEFGSWREYFNSASGRGHVEGCEVEYIPEKSTPEMTSIPAGQLAAFDAVMPQMRELFLRKNAGYGSEAIGDAGLYGIAVRMNDKIKRLMHITRTEGAVSDETLEDTALDLAVYAAIALVYMRGKWGANE
jgi:hypothetical protein